jgi:large conductance mechanosensitive channel
MIKGFRDFITRGNVVDLAVGIVIGAAFGALINQFVESFINPLVRLATGGKQASGRWPLTDSVSMDWAFVNQLITFLLTAAAATSSSSCRSTGSTSGAAEAAILSPTN